MPVPSDNDHRVRCRPLIRQGLGKGLKKEPRSVFSRSPRDISAAIRQFSCFAHGIAWSFSDSKGPNHRISAPSRSLRPRRSSSSPLPVDQARER